MKVDFFILNEATQQQALLFACQCIEKARAENEHVFIHTNSKEEAERLDNLLWTFKEDSFLAHSIHDPEDMDPPPIQIGYQHAPQQGTQTLVNLSRALPDFHTRFSRIIEIVFSEPQHQQAARERYRHYREQQYELNTHKL